MFKNTRTLITMVVTLLFLLGSNIFISYQLTNNIEKDAKVINNAGIIRGSIQRLTKLELQGKESNSVINEIDSVFLSFREQPLSLKGRSQEFRNLIDQIFDDWCIFKQAIYNYRIDKSTLNADTLLNSSEEIWDKANKMVLSAQLFSEKKVSYFNYFILLLFVNLIPMIAILIHIKIYVKGRLEYQANHDPLTKAFNRNFLYTFLNNEIKRLERFNGNLSLIMIDIDHFKRINDEFGHDVGDSVLIELTGLLLEDTRKSDLVSRIGGEEFLIVALNASVENAKILAEKIRLSVMNQAFKRAGRITVSIGISSYESGDNFDSLFKRSDLALYKAKNNGRNRVELSNAE